MREISPAENASVEEIMNLASPQQRQFVSDIRRQKESGTRPKPSSSLVDRSTLRIPIQRRALLDAVADLVDENLCGRSDMCIQFADLLQQVLSHLGLPARSVIGQAIYYSNGREIFRWKHAWVRVGKEVIDGNVDSLYENPRVPPTVKVLPYWGPIVETPRDRMLRENHGHKLPPDLDVSNIWWPELRSWMDKEFMNQDQHGADKG